MSLEEDISRIEKACDGNPRSRGGLNVPEIKTILASRGLYTAGTREELLSRLKNVNQDKQLNALQD